MTVGELDDLDSKRSIYAGKSPPTCRRFVDHAMRRSGIDGNTQLAQQYTDCCTLGEGKDINGVRYSHHPRWTSRLSFPDRALIPDGRGDSPKPPGLEGQERSLATSTTQIITCQERSYQWPECNTSRPLKRLLILTPRPARSSRQIFRLKVESQKGRREEMQLQPYLGGHTWDRRHD